MNSRIASALAATTILLAGCVVDNSPSKGQQAQEYLTKWMTRNHPGIIAEPSGIYILENTVEGTVPVTEKYVYSEITIRSLSGAVASTDNEELAKQLGKYAATSYFGPRFMTIEENVSYAGVDALLSGMNVGDTRRAIIPSWLLTASRYGTQAEYIAAATSSTHLDYTIKVFDQTSDISEWEKQKLASWVKSVHGAAAESTAIYEGAEADGTFWFITTAEGSGDDLADGTSININYTGTMLGGKVFDTTVEDRAIDAGINSSSKTYSTVTCNWSPTYSSVTMSGSSSLIEGFKAGLAKMTKVGQKAFVYFTSDHGYTSSGQSGTIPGYMPLCFELEIASL
ncbi:MAG: FKBP-type peptidyl-prolyl cis-trans isomerase [Bacteroidales bacterium]|nr:FKBP-type peptidyl-prolyl cis-trans isomerase [Bacteroidales bacterium]